MPTAWNTSEHILDISLTAYKKYFLCLRDWMSRYRNLIECAYSRVQGLYCEFNNPV